MKVLRSKIRKDVKYKKFEQIIEMNVERLNVNNLLDEIGDIAEIRTKTALVFNQSSDSIKQIIDQNLKAQAYRSRLSEICVQCNRISSLVNLACEKIKDYINVTYSKEISSIGRTKEERGTVISSLMHTALEFISGLNSVIEMAEIIIADIDKQHYSLKLTIDALNLHVNKEHILG